MGKTKTSRITSGFREVRSTPDGSIPPYMEHLRPKHRARPTERQRERKALAVGEARRNDTVALVRLLATPTRKRGGARFGPAPKRDPHPDMQAPKPMTDDRREEIYNRGRWTPRKLRQFWRTGAENLYREYQERYDERADITSPELRGQL